MKNEGVPGTLYVRGQIKVYKTTFSRQG